MPSVLFREPVIQVPLPFGVLGFESGGARKTLPAEGEDAMPGVGAEAQRQILRAALRAFTRKGYHGATIREIADEAGVSVAGLYHHFVSKEQLLEQIMDDTMDRLIVATVQTVALAGEDPAAQLQAAVAAHVRFHIEYQRESFVGNTEIRSLGPVARRRILEKRDRQRRVFDAAVESGIDRGVFLVPYPAEASRGVVTMCTAVATWYRRSGALCPEEIVERYCALALHIVGHRDVLADEGAGDTRNHNEED
jgi:AcrR family transcriptional regulator